MTAAMVSNWAPNAYREGALKSQFQVCFRFVLACVGMFAQFETGVQNAKSQIADDTGCDQGGNGAFQFMWRCGGVSCKSERRQNCGTCMRSVDDIRSEIDLGICKRCRGIPAPHPRHTRAIPAGGPCRQIAHLGGFCHRYVNIW